MKKATGKLAGYQRLRADSGQHRRIVTVMLVSVLAFLPLIAQLTGLMVVSFEYYARKALRNQTRSTSVTADRGTIYDRNMNILACSETVENVYLDPHEMKQGKMDIPAVARKLGEILDLDPVWVEEKAGNTRLRYQQIAAGVDAQTAGEIRSYMNEEKIVGVHLEPSSRRSYPFGTLAAQVIGFVNASNTGAEGIEASYNSYLEGAAGRVITTKGNNEMDMPFSYEQYLNASKGNDLVLTLDATVQACLEKQMQAAIARYDVQNGAFGLVMDVNTGQILAMSTLGNYDPNAYLELKDPEAVEQVEQLRLAYLQHPEGSEGYIAGRQAYSQALTQARLKQWRNRCLSDGYEPGSTFKTLTMAAALDCGAIDLQTSFHCSGSEQIPGRSQRLHCWRSAGHGSEQTPQALQNSCNIAFAHIALKMGGEQFYDYIEAFGILEKTGIDLAGESSGIFFDRELVTNTSKWGTASLTSGSFGQTFKITPLQLARAVAAVVNGGYLMEPYIVSEVTDSQGNVLLQQEPTVIRQVIREETSRTMCGLIESVVTEGTAKNASVAGFSIGGKTGTSEKIDVFDENGQRVQDKIVSFVGIAPMNDPQYLVLVALDTPSRSTGIYISGGVMAAPTVGAVMADILPYLGVERNDTEPGGAGTLVETPDLTGMNLKEAGKAAQAAGLTVKAVGEGDAVTGQIPSAGQSIPGQSQVLLYFDEIPETETVQVPDFLGSNRQQARELAGALGLYILVAGNTGTAPSVTVSRQSVAAGTEVTRGSTITLTFTDTQALD